MSSSLVCELALRGVLAAGWEKRRIQEIWGEFDGAMWFDSSIKFKGNNSHDVLQRLARQRSGFMFFVGITGHSIIAAAHPGTDGIHTHQNK